MDTNTGGIAGISSAATHGSGKPVPTDQCHDITVYAALGLAAGACDPQRDGARVGPGAVERDVEGRALDAAEVDA